MKNLILVLVTFSSISSLACDNLLNEEMRLLDSTVKENLCKYEGKVMLVVNVASKCGYTGQYQGLQSLYERFKDQEFVVIGVPSRDFFSQEFSDESQIAEFCETNFDVSFPMYSTVPVKGNNAHPFYKKLSYLTGSEPTWNFNKYLISKDGKSVRLFNSKVLPGSSELTEAILELL